MSSIFISYRRSDADYPSDRIYAELARVFGKEHIFKDVDNIIGGSDFRVTIENALKDCRVLLVIIGPTWVNTVDRNGQKRLFDPNDFVRIEIESALLRGIPIFPILVGGARMPTSEELPPSLVQLANQQARLARPDPDFFNDMQKIINEVAVYVPQGNAVSQYQMDRRVSPQLKSRGIAMLLEIFIPGAGAFYTDHLSQGFLWLFGNLIGIPLIYGVFLALISSSSSSSSQAVNSGYIEGALSVAFTIYLIGFIIRLVRANTLVLQFNAERQGMPQNEIKAIQSSNSQRVLTVQSIVIGLLIIVILLTPGLGFDFGYLLAPFAVFALIQGIRALRKNKSKRDIASVWAIIISSLSVVFTLLMGLGRFL